MKAYLILTCMCLGTISVSILLFKLLKNEKKKNKELKKQIESQQSNLKALCEYTEKVSEIQKNKSKTDTKIERAKSEKELLDIVNDIIAANNKLCNNKEN